MARRSRTRDLAGLAALGALGYSIFGAEGRRRKDGSVAPVEERDVRGAAPGRVVPSSAAPAPAPAPAVVAGPRDTFMGLDDVSGPQADTGGLGRVDVGAADQRKMPPPVFNAQAAQAAAPARAAAPQRLASPDADFPSAGRTRAAPATPAAAPIPLRQQLTRTTLGTPIAPDPDAPSIYAGPEAWAAYRQRQAARSAAQPPTQQGSARNIVQQMREKDKAVLAAVRRRQAEEEAAAQATREAQAERLREARRVQPPSVNPAASRFQDIQARMQGFKKGGAVKAKKMASGGMSSASKRADGIATKGKTKCKMY